MNVRPTTAPIVINSHGMGEYSGFGMLGNKSGEHTHTYSNMN